MVKMKLSLIGLKIWKNKGFIFIASVALFLFGASIFGVQGTQGNKNKDVLGTRIDQSIIPSKTPTPTPTPQKSLTTIQITRPISSPTPTPLPTLLPDNAGSSAQNNPPTPSPTPSPAPVATTTPTPSPTPSKLNLQIAVDYAGEKSNDSYNASIDPGQTAWDAVVSAIGIGNLQYTDYGGDLGIFINSFNGIAAASNQYYEFRVNGVSSNIGVSGYSCSDGDKLDFVLTSF